MQGLLDLMKMGGSMMYLVLLLGVAGLVFGVVHLAAGRTWSLIVGALLVALCAGAGLLGTQMGMHLVNQALAGVAPEHRTALRAQGEYEAGLNWKFGALAAGVAALPLVAGEIRRRVA
jgi:hypothetical protein